MSQFSFSSEPNMSVLCSRLCFRLLTIFCLCVSAALCKPESSSVIRRNTGGSVTIQCRSSDANLQNICLKKGIHRDAEIFFKSKSSEKSNFAANVKDRAQFNGKFPDLDILLTNLSSDDTGVYWCLYKKFDSVSATPVVTEGQGSVLLMVTDATFESDKLKPQQCDHPNKNLVMTSVVISSVVLLGIIAVLFFVVIRKMKVRFSAEKHRPVPNNDVYEDMRGTIRR